MQNELPNINDLFKGTPLNEEQTTMLGLDLDLSFLNGFVDEQKSKGMVSYDPAKSLSAENSNIPTAHLNFKAYEQEMPKIATINQPLGASGSETLQKETLQNNPVFNSTNQAQPAGGELNLNVNNVKNIWGS